MSPHQELIARAKQRLTVTRLGRLGARETDKDLDIMSQLIEALEASPPKNPSSSLAKEAREYLEKTRVLSGEGYNEKLIAKLADAVDDLADAIRLTVEYTGNDMLPAKEGWSWFDALMKYHPELVKPFVENPLLFPPGLTSPAPVDRETLAKALFDVRDDEFDDDEWEDIPSVDRERWYCYADAALAVSPAPVDREKLVQFLTSREIATRSQYPDHMVSFEGASRLADELLQAFSFPAPASTEHPPGDCTTCGHTSDCSLHNESAMVPTGPCSCKPTPAEQAAMLEKVRKYAEERVAYHKYQGPRAVVSSIRIATDLFDILGIEPNWESIT